MSKTEDTDIPNIIYDENERINYQKGRYFGKGGFAKCYEVINMGTKRAYAGKIVPKTLMTKQHQKDKMMQEVTIHSSLAHRNIVGFHSFFEDNLNVYIILELCRKRSMMELHKRRKALTEPETRFFMKQILEGVSYLHKNRIIHRDLKLGNLFLNDQLHVKIGDFGLAARIEYDGERKKTLCGTPNYIAPEILNKEGHSFEVDIWSIGCIMYTLLIGKPPFETSSLKETYAKIKKCDYKISTTVSSAAKHMIMIMLQPVPKSRPKVDQLLAHEFIRTGYLPPSLPVSCLTMAPRFGALESGLRRPLSEVNQSVEMILSPAKHDSIAAGLAGAKPSLETFDDRENFMQLKGLLVKVLRAKHPFMVKISDEMTDPAAQPMVWVSKWVDYSDKYGFGYQLSDEGVGVMFNDATRLIMLPNNINVHYVDKGGVEVYMTVDNYPHEYEKKMRLLSYFSRYMREHLVKTGDHVAKEIDYVSRSPHLHQWCRSTSGVLMQLSTGTVQMNFCDHTKIIMCPLMAAITFIEEDKSFRTFRFATIEKNGCTKKMYEKMRYAYDKIAVLLEQPNKLT